MFKRIYINNYKCLVNFDCQIDNINLFLGKNGSGKSTVLEVLTAMQQFVCHGGKTEAVFKTESRTRWQKLNCQDFELEIENEEGVCYKYQE